MKNIICSLFGHTQPNGIEKNHGKLQVNSTDSSGRVSGTVTIDCARCGDVYEVCHVYIPNKDFRVDFKNIQKSDSDDIDVNKMMSYNLFN